MVIGINAALEPWRDRLYWRGINLLCVSADGLTSNPDGIADKVCEHIFRVSVENLHEMIAAGMPLAAVSAFTGIDSGEIARMVPRFFGKSITELREEAGL